MHGFGVCRCYGCILGEKDILVEEISITHQQFFTGNTFSCEYVNILFVPSPVWGEKRGWNLIPKGMKHVW